MHDKAISLDPDAVARTLAFVALFIVVANAFGQVAALFVDDTAVHAIARFLYVDEEKNLPTGFSVLLLLLAASLLACIATLERQRGGAWARHWALLGLGFLVMAVDEAWSFHEKLIRPGRELLGGDDLGIFFYGWVIFGIALVLLLVPVLARFVFGLSVRIRRLFLVAAALYLGGAIGAELVAGHFNELHDLHEAKGTHGIRQYQYSLIATAEESLEMAGSIVFIRALMLHMSGAYGEVRFRLVAPG